MLCAGAAVGGFAAEDAADERATNTFPFRLYVLAYEGVDEEDAAYLAQRLEEFIDLPVEVLEQRPEAPEELLDPERNQYRVLEVLEHSLDMAPENTARLLAIFPGDVYLGNAEYNFGLADPDGRGALVSTARLASPLQARFRVRMLKTALHELGHTFGLKHEKYPVKCVMVPSRGVSALDERPVGYSPQNAEFLKQAVSDLRKKLLEQAQGGASQNAEP